MKIMGRYYSGDIDGKFWFGVQSSNAADRFGVTGIMGTVSEELEYYFDESDLESVNKELKSIKDYLGHYLDLLDAFFNKNFAYLIEELAEELNIEVRKAKSLLSEYADYLLGIEIRDCIINEGSCEFKAELW